MNDDDVVVDDIVVVNAQRIIMASDGNERCQMKKCWKVGASGLSWMVLK
jgi:hypothetical protein